MSDKTTERAAEASPGLTTAVMRASLSSRMFDTPAPAVSIDRFRVLRIVGQGAIGAVYEAYDPRLDRRLALKLVRGGLPEKAQTLLLDEARTLAKVVHPNVVTLFDAGTVEDRVYIAMEFVSGGALSDWLADASRSVMEILDAFGQAGQGLAAAHRLGIVHRDFKPANVMRTEEGLVKVGDFGLARALAVAPVETTGEQPMAGSGSSDGLVTSTVAGTPAYMAPEALDGTIDPRSDQFSFCVALWEALFGERPAAGIQAVAQGDATPDRSGERRVPRRVVAAIVRGLSVDPSGRWPSMQALLSALQPRTAVRMWQGAAILAVGGLVGSALAFEPAAEPCTFPDDGLAGAWDEPRKQEARVAFEALELPYARSTWSRVEGSLDAYATSWTEARQQACEVSLVRHERSPEAYDLASACLERHRDALAELTSVLMEPDATVAERAVVATGDLPSLAACREMDRLRDGAPPADPATRDAAQELRRGLDRVAALLDFGRIDDAGRELVPLIASADALAQPRLLAEAKDLEGRVADARGDFNAAAEAFEASLEHAARGRHDRHAAAVWISLVDVVGGPLARSSDALSLGLAARVAVARAEDDGELLASLEHAIGSAYKAGDDLPNAEAHHRKGLALRREHEPDNALGLAVSLARLGDVLVLQRRSAEGIEILTEVRDRFSEALSPDHPRVASAEAGLGRAFASAGRMDEAVECFRRAVEVSEAALGPEHPKTLTRLGMLGTLLGQTRKAAEGIEILERILPAYQSRPDDPKLLALLNNLGGLYDAVGRAEDSLNAHAQLREVLIEQGKRDSSIFAMNNSNLALMQSDLGRYGEAEKNFRESIEVYEAAYGPDHPELWRPNAMFAAMLRRTDRAAEGLPFAERAVAVLAGATSDPNEVADAEFELARTRWEVGRRGAETIALAKQARDRWLEIDLKEHAGDVDAWLDGKE
jgi:tetratricopeptide (TPR) repeat protein